MSLRIRGNGVQLARSLVLDGHLRVGHHRARLIFDKSDDGAHVGLGKGGDRNENHYRGTEEGDACSRRARPPDNAGYRMNIP